MKLKSLILIFALFFASTVNAEEPYSAESAGKRIDQLLECGTEIIFAYEENDLIYRHGSNPRNAKERKAEKEHAEAVMKGFLEQALELRKNEIEVIDGTVSMECEPQKFFLDGVIDKLFKNPFSQSSELSEFTDAAKISGYRCSAKAYFKGKKECKAATERSRKNTR